MRMKPTNSNFNLQRNYILMIEEEIRDTWIYFKLWPFEKVINVLKKKRWSREVRKRLTSGNHCNLCKVVREALPTTGWWMGKAYRNDEMSLASVWERKFRHFSRALCHWLKGKTSKEALAMTVAFHVQYRAEGPACPLSWMTVSSPTLRTCNQLIWIQTTLFSTSSQFFDLDENSVKNVK